MPGSLLLVLAAAVSSTTLSSSAAFTASQSACMSSFRLQQMTPFTGCPLSMLPRRTPGVSHFPSSRASHHPLQIALMSSISVCSTFEF